MNKIIEIYSYILKEHISKCFSKQQTINPVEISKERFKIRALFISAVIFLKNNSEKRNSNIIFEANDWFKKNFDQKNLFSLIIEDSDESISKHIDDSLSCLIGLEAIDINTLYETLLSIETGNDSSIVKILTGKNYRNKLGSYYTPSDLANIVTEKTIDTYFELNNGIERLSAIDSDNINTNEKENLLNEIRTLRFADFSCGCGKFLIQVIDYFEKVFSRLNVDAEKKIYLLRSIASNISAFDVDCLALEVAKLSLILKINLPSFFSKLNGNFIHANFLLHTDSAIDSLMKLNIFSSGFIYHEQLALNRNSLEKKYDIILGNPPWEKIRFEEKRFYALYSSGIADNHFKSSRKDEINKTELNNTYLADFSAQYKLEIGKAKSELKKNTFFGLSNNGELNTYALFTEAAVKLKSEKSVVGLVLKSAIATSQVNQRLFSYLTKESLIVAIYDFVNRKKIFNIDSRERFCFLLLGNSQNSKFHISMNLNIADEIQNIRPEIELSYERLKILNPFTGMLPNFSTKEEADFLLRISYEFPFFKKVFDKVRFGRIVHLTNHSDYISREQTSDNVAIYEGKFFNQFDGKYSGFNGVPEKLRYGSKSSSIVLNDCQKSKPACFPESRYFINREKWLQLSKNHCAKFMLGWRSLTSATNTRTCIATLLPFIPASQSVQFLTTNESDLLYLNGLFNSVVFDFILKIKLSGIDLTQSVINQIPVPSINQIMMKLNFNGYKATIKQHISLLVFSLLKNDLRLKPLFENLGINYEYAIEENRFELTRNIDLLFILLYKLTNLELELALNSFKKQYSKNDFSWFKIELEKLYSDNTVSPSNAAFPTFSPV
ncbi:MAG: hypothetical protein GY795_49205 [Desulfobacterales bacterium]|nr:hypothetical protein [Desulfobacterales bacterium]